MREQILDTLSYSNKIIVSPDIDGFTSARLLEAFNGSVVVGTYDKNVMALADGVDPKECLFVDCDMNTSDFISIGNHQRLSSGDNIAKESFNPNVHYGITKYTDKYPFATAFLISFATRVPTSEQTQAYMSYADSTYKNLLSYGVNMRTWWERMRHLELDLVFEPTDSISNLITELEELYPSQGFVSKRLGKTNYLKKMNGTLQDLGINHMPLSTGMKYITDRVGKNTVVKYNQDIVSYAEIFGGEYSVTYNEEMSW
jgi:hypothetical protein